MSSPPYSAASPPSTSGADDTYFGMNLTEQYLALTAICFVFTLYAIVFAYYKGISFSEAAAAAADTAASGESPAEKEIVKIEASDFSYGETDNGSDEKDIECAICLNEFEEGQNCQMMKSCGHVFHRSCIHRWLTAERHCPLCRNTVCIVVQP